MTEVGLDDAGVARDRGGRACGDQPSLREHPDMLGQAHHRLHHVLDHQHGDAAACDGADYRDHVGDLLRVEARQHLVEEQQARLRRQRACELQSLAAGDGEICGGLVELRGEADLRRHAFGGGERGSAARFAQVRADGDVLAHGLRRERLHDLEGARQAGARIEVRRAAGDVVSGEADASAVGNEKAGHQREERRLAGTVGTDERAQATLRNIEGDTLHGLQSAEGDGDVFEAEAEAQPARPGLQAARTSRPTPDRPRGTNSTIRISTTP